MGLWSKEPADVAEVRKFIRQEIEPHLLSREDIQKRFGIKAGGDTRASRSARQVERPRAPAVVQGFCIRCAVGIELDPEKPYCWEHYQKWAQYGNVDYEDSYCHGCGDDFPATMSKPLCRSCYRKMRD